MKEFINKFVEYFFFGDSLNIIWWPPVIIFVNRAIFETYNLYTFIGSSLIVMLVFSIIKANTVTQVKKHQSDDDK